MKFLLGTFILLIFTGCEVSMGTGDSGEPTTVYDQKSYANEAKLISPSIDDPRDESTYDQGFYDLSPSRRLMIRLKNIGSRTNRAIVNEENKMIFTLSADEFAYDKTPYYSSIKVCPITKKWMILATWNRANSLPTSSANWRNAGGDFSDSDCVTADPSYEDADSDTLYFDVTNWYLYYIQSKKKNYGLMVLTDSEITIYGDADSLRAPKFLWKMR